MFCHALTFVLISATYNILLDNMYFFVFSTNCATIICEQDGCTCLHSLEKKSMYV